MKSKIELIIPSRAKDLGGFEVRRLIPVPNRRMIGPFIFFDHMGPAEFKPGYGINVRPHPHIGLATVTYLFEGKIFHRDSLGHMQPIEPGAINWMTAGHGIVHSERTPDELKETGYKINGIQCWVALPKSYEEAKPTFQHHPASDFPEFKIDNVSFRLLLGKAFDKQSPVQVYCDMFYLETKMPKGSSFEFPARGLESGFYIVKGSIRTEDQTHGDCTMIVAKNGENLRLEALEDSHLMILGGENIGERFIWWNLVSSSKERLEEAKQDWIQGPRTESSRFKPIPGDDQEFIPAPDTRP